jgi:hypothetical protein
MEDLVFLQLDFPDTEFKEQIDCLKRMLDEQIKADGCDSNTYIFGIARHPDIEGVCGNRINNRIHEKMFNLQKHILATYFPEFVWNQTFLHCNYMAEPHIDKILPTQEVIVISFGDYDGGNLNIVTDSKEEVEVHTKDRISITLGGRYLHWNLPIKGFKYSFCTTLDHRCPAFGKYEQFR